MANTLKTVVTYPLDGQTVDFAIPFDYLARKFVKLTLLGKDRKELLLNTDYRFATRKTISLTRPWGSADGYAQLEMRRYTSATERLVDFTDGSILRAYDLNVAQLQTMHIAEEARDLTADTIGVNNNGDLDARGHRIINVAEAREDGDAVSLGTLKGFSNNAWQARNEAEGFRDEAERFQQLAATEADRAAGEVGKVAEGVGEAKQWADKAREEAGKAAGEVSKAAGEVGKAKQWADKARDEAESVKLEAATIEGAVERAKIAADMAEDFRNQTRLEASKVEGEAEIAKGQADRAKSEADRAKEEADKISATNQISAALESVTPTAVTFNRGVASRSHLRCATTDGNLPFTGVQREGGAELYMTVDSNGNAGFTIGSPSNSPQFRAYWDTQGSTYVSAATMNLDQGSRQIKGSLEVGQGSNSAIHMFSKGDGSPDELVSVTKWKWRNGGVELGTIRGQSDACTGIIRTTSGGSKVSYKQDADEGTHIFLGDADKTVLTIHEDGDIETPLFGRLSEKLSGSGGGGGSGGDGSGGGGGSGDEGDTSNVKNWKMVGTINDRDGSKFNSSFPLTGRRGYIKFAQDNGVVVNVYFTYPPFDSTFQLLRGSSSGTFSMMREGLEIRLRSVSPEKWGGVYQFFAYNPDAQVLDYAEEVDTEYGVF